MSSPKLIRGSAIAGALAGVLVLAGGFLPFPSEARAVALCFSGVLSLFFLKGHYQRQSAAIDTFGRIGYYAFCIALLLLIGRSFLWIVIGSNLFGFLTEGITVVIFIWGTVLYGTATLRVGYFPQGATLLWVIGLMQTPLLVSWMPARILACVGMIWTCYALWFGITPTQSEPPVPIETSKGLGERFLALDALRGLIMVLMAIDHAGLIIRKWHPFELWDMPLPYYASAGPFLTRLVTHLCAPGFFFLMGVGMILFAQSRSRSGWTQFRITKFFFQRGLLLIVIEQLLLNPLSNGRLNPTFYGVLFGLGGVMIAGSLFIRSGKGMLATLGVGVVLATQIIPTGLQALEIYFPLWVRFLLVPGRTGDWFVLYPVLPWLGIAALGMAFGLELKQDREKAYRLALFSGLIALMLFPVVRGLGGFGNFKPPEISGWIYFLNVVKYPPSLAFTLLTMGVNLILLYLFHKGRDGIAKWGQPFMTFGRTALYFYVAHWFLYVAIGWFFRRAGGLPLTYIGWWMGLVMLYPICRQFESLKKQTKPDSVWRLL